MPDARQPEGTRGRLPVPGTSPAAGAPAHGPTDRGRMLRRPQRTTFHLNGSDGPRLRRQRRVCASFSGIPDLARNGRNGGS
jgi:hypothetical protein